MAFSDEASKCQPHRSLNTETGVYEQEREIAINRIPDVDMKYCSDPPLWVIHSRSIYWGLRLYHGRHLPVITTIFEQASRPPEGGKTRIPYRSSVSCSPAPGPILWATTGNENFSWLQRRQSELALLYTAGISGMLAAD